MSNRGGRSAEANKKGGLPPRRLRVVVDYVQSHLSERIALRKMAELAQMSPYHFGRQFKQSMGATPHQYVLDQRILKARHLLADSDLPVAEIARQVGFAGRSHFSTVFRKEVGMSPRKYRLKC